MFLVCGRVLDGIDSPRGSHAVHAGEDACAELALVVMT